MTEATAPLSTPAVPAVPASAAATVGATPAPTTPAPTAPTTAPAAGPVPWLTGDVPPELVGVAQNAGWQGPADAVKSYHELQKLFGADRHGRTIVLPKDDAAPEEWAKFHERLGRPADAKAYGIAAAEGADPKFADGFAAKAHELGLSTKQAQALAGWYGEFGGAMTAEQAAATEAALAAEHQALAKDWGTGPEAGMRRELAKRAAMHLGLDEAAIDAMEKVAGYSKTMKALAKVGDLMRESGAEGLNELGSFGMTPEGAKAKKSQLMADPSWRKAAMNPSSREWAELQKLDGILAAASGMQ